MKSVIGLRKKDEVTQQIDKLIFDSVELNLIDLNQTSEKIRELVDIQNGNSSQKLPLCNW